VPHEGAGDAGAATAGDAGDPQPPLLVARAGEGLPHPAFAGATIVGATAADRGCAGGAQVAATPAV